MTDRQNIERILKGNPFTVECELFCDALDFLNEGRNQWTNRSIIAGYFAAKEIFCARCKNCKEWKRADLCKANAPCNVFNFMTADNFGCVNFDKKEDSNEV